MNAKRYTVRVVPSVKVREGNDENGAPKPPIVKYIRKSAPSEKALKANYKPEEFLHLELYLKGDSILGGDNKPFTQVLFRNSNSILFDTIADLLEDPSNYKELQTATKLRILNEALPGLVRKVDCDPYYATLVDAEGKTVKLQAQRRKDDGNYEKEPVVLTNVTFFMFDSQVHDDDDDFRKEEARLAKAEIDRAMRHKVIQTTNGNVAAAVDKSKLPSKEEEPE